MSCDRLPDGKPNPATIAVERIIAAADPQLKPQKFVRSQSHPAGNRKQRRAAKAKR